MKPSVLFVASTGSHIRNFHLPYLRAFRERGWTVHVACGTSAGEIPCADRVLELPFEKKMSAPSNFRAAALLRRAILEEDYDLVTVHTSLAAFFARFALLGLKKRPAVVNMVHGYLYDDETSAVKCTILRTAERLTAPVTDLVLTMNGWDKGEAERYRLGKRVASVPGVGVEFGRLNHPERFDVSVLRGKHDIPADAFVLIYAAEFSKRKNQEFLVRAMKRLPADAYLVLAGQGALLEECKLLAHELNVADRILFPGHIDVGEWYAVADAVVSASRSEGLPFNIMEAMYLGLPVVASAVKGHADLLREDESGLLYPFGDADAYVCQVVRLMKEPELRTKLGSRAATDVLAYDLETVLPQVMAEYEGLVPVTANAR